MCVAPVLRWGCNFEQTTLTDLLRNRTVTRKNITEQCANGLLIYEKEIGHQRLNSWETPDGVLTIQATETERHNTRLGRNTPASADNNEVAHRKVSPNPLFSL